ncbi:MAG: hypothetical protein JWR05_2484 [Mucilaginibacter sp.]|nr:hypothetical protein [Mucilaginibacter sp.]
MSGRGRYAIPNTVMHKPYHKAGNTTDFHSGFGNMLNTIAVYRVKLLQLFKKYSYLNNKPFAGGQCRFVQPFII